MKTNPPKPSDVPQPDSVSIRSLHFHDDGTNVVLTLRIANSLSRTIHAVSTPRNFQYQPDTNTLRVLLSDRENADMPGSVLMMPSFIAVDPGGETALTLKLPRILTRFQTGQNLIAPQIERLLIHEATSVSIEMDWSDTPFYPDTRSEKSTRAQVVAWAQSIAKAQGGRSDPSSTQ